MTAATAAATPSTVSQNQSGIPTRFRPASQPKIWVRTQFQKRSQSDWPARRPW